MVRYGQEVLAEFTRLGDQPSLADIIPIARVVIDDYSSGIVDEVYLCYAQFVTTVTQRPVLWKLLPIEPAAIEETFFDGRIEPEVGKVLFEPYLTERPHMAQTP